MKKYSVGYTQGVYDMFHIGHLNLINNAKQQCDYLIVGVNSDELVKNYKKKVPVVNENERVTIVENIKAVDKSIIVHTLDKTEIYGELKFDAIFIGDDWKGNKRWAQTEEELNKFGVDVVYLPHTPEVSSTILRDKNDDKVGE